MLQKILLAVIIIAALLAIIVALQPSHYEVTRTASVAAPQADVFGLVNDFHKWDQWSPWAKIDPAMKTTYEGPPAGTGAAYKWAGNSQAGEGRMEILDSRPADLVHVKLDFLKPFPSTALTDFKFATAAGATNVTWTMSGENNFMAKGFIMFMGGMDKMIGPDFEKGLAQMKSAAEAAVRR